MWKLSEVVVRKYLITWKSIYNIIFAPQIGVDGSLGKQFLQYTNAKFNSNILNQQKNLLKMNNMAQTVLKSKKEILNSIRIEIFEKEKLIATLSCDAPVYHLMKKRIVDANDDDVIQMWKQNIYDGLNYTQTKSTILKNIEELSQKMNNIIPSNSSDIKILDAKQFQKINYLEISELFSHDMQCLLFQLYKNDKLILHNFILLFNSLLTQLHHQLKSNPLETFSECLLQIEASCKDINEALNIFQTYSLEITKMLSETHNILREKNVVQIHDDTVLPIMNNVLLSPFIKIDSDCSDEVSDLQKRVQFTPVEATHKSLFSRYERLKENHILHESKLRENLLVHRINFDDTILSTNSEKPSLQTPTTSFKKNLSSFKQAEKYSRLFSTRVKKNNRTANSSIMSIPCSAKANSTAIANAMEEMHDISELTVNISTKSLCNASMEFVTPEKLTVEQQNKSENVSEMEDVVNALPNKPNVVIMYETIEQEITINCDNNIVEKEQTKSHRRSIGDLVERYKKLLERNNRKN
ncbi:uncharacterized protein LOC143147895 isoform X2 [Ptiloglossa arizonensis]